MARSEVDVAALTVEEALHAELLPAAIRFDGQISVYDLRRADSPCYACLFPPDQKHEEVACSTLGVLGPLVGMVGTMQAAEALKILSGMGSQLIGRLLMIDGKRMGVDEIKLMRNLTCGICCAS